MASSAQMPAIPPPVRSMEDCDKELQAAGQMHEIVEENIRGRKLRVYKNAPPSLRAFWLSVSEGFAARDYVVLEGAKMTYGECRSRSISMAALLQQKYRCKKGDRVAILMRNRFEWVTSWWACHLLGCVPVLVNAWVAPDGIIHCLKISDAVVVVVDDERAAVLDSQRKALNALKLRGVLVVTDSAQAPKGMAVLSKSLEPYASHKDLPTVEIAPDDDGTIFFTSGTTSFPKAVLSTNRAFITNLMNSIYGSRRATLRKGETIPVVTPEDPQKVVLVAIPFFHVTACASFLQLFTAIGGKMVLMHKWSVKEAIRLCKDHGVTYTGGVPFIAQELLENTKEGELPELESVAYGGAPCGDNVPRLAASRPSLMLGQAYGLTETNAVVAGHAGEDYLRRPLSTGPPSPVNDIKILSEDGKELPVGQPGEICISGPNVMVGYYNDKKATEAAFTSDGFFKSGDVGYFDKEGYLYISDRAKDIIIRGGENIAATVVENALYRNEAVQDCAVVAVKDEKLGELPAAVVMLRVGEKYKKTTEKDIIAAVRAHIPRHAVPVMVMLRSPGDDDASTRIERNPNGKIVKTQLRKIVDAEWQRRHKSKL